MAGAQTAVAYLRDLFPSSALTTAQASLLIQDIAKLCINAQQWKAVMDEHRRGRETNTFNWATLYEGLRDCQPKRRDAGDSYRSDRPEVPWEIRQSNVRSNCLRYRRAIESIPEAEWRGLQAKVKAGPYGPYRAASLLSRSTLINAMRTNSTELKAHAACVAYFTEWFGPDWERHVNDINDNAAYERDHAFSGGGR